MAKQTIAEKRVKYYEMVVMAKRNDFSTPGIDSIEKPEDLKWRTHKEADEAIGTLSAAILFTAKNGQTTQKEKTKMTLKELQAEYDSKLEELNGAGDFKPKKFKTKADAMAALDDIELFEETGAGAEEGLVDEPEKKEKKAKKDKSEKKAGAPGTKPDGSVNRVQWVILGLFSKKNSMKMAALKDAYMKAEDKEKATIVPAQVGMLVKMGMLEKEGEKDEAKITITAEGKEAAKVDEPSVGTPSKPKKPDFVPPYSDEEIEGAKKKKAKKMKEANAEALAKYKEEHGRTQTPTPDHLKSKYEGTVPEGRWQKGRKNQKSYSSSRAVMDLFEQVCWDEDAEVALMSKADFIKLCVEEHGINEGNVRTNLNGMIRHHKVPKEAWDNVSEKPAKKENAEPKADKKKDKKKKKGKK